MVRGIFYAVFQTFLHEKNQRFSPVLFLCRQGGNGMNYDMKESGKRIAELRKEKGLTQEQLAEKLNISTSNLGKLERGLQSFSIDLLIEIGFFFGVSTDYLLLGCSIPHYDIGKEFDSLVTQMQALKKNL